MARRAEATRRCNRGFGWGWFWLKLPVGETDKCNCLRYGDLGSLRGKRLEAASPYNSGYNFLPWSFGTKIKEKKNLPFAATFLSCFSGLRLRGLIFFMGHVIQHVADGINWKSSMLVAMTSCWKKIHGSFQMQTATTIRMVVVVSLFYKKDTQYGSSYYNTYCVL